MKLEGFIGQAYALDSPNVDAQRCVNLYPEIIESGRGKEGQVAYLRGTPGLELFEEIGDGPIRCIHVDSIGRIFVVSGGRLYLLLDRNHWKVKVTPVSISQFTVPSESLNVDPTTNLFTKNSHGLESGLKVRVTSSGTLPGGLTAGVDYWVSVTSTNRFGLSTSLSNALAGVLVDITSASDTDTTIFTPQIPSGVTLVGADALDAESDILKKTAHGLFTGAKVQIEAVGSLPAGLAASTDYYIISNSPDSFQLATSMSNSVAGTAIDFDASDEDWELVLVGADGEWGGNAVAMSTSSGLVKAASMSLAGDGTDSSTVFVDGSANYLFKDEVGTTTFENLGAVPVAETIFDVADDITIYSTTDVESILAEGSFTIERISSTTGVAAGEIEIDLYSDGTPGQPIPLPYDFVLTIRLGSGATLTTAELVQFMSEGSVSGKTILYNTNNLPQNHVGAQKLSRERFVYSGGGSQAVASAWTSDTEYTQAFSASTRTGAEFGAVPNATDVTWSDGYFILIEGGTNRFRVSDIQSFNLDTLSFASSEGSPDIALACEVLNRYLYIFNEKTTEVYANTGNADFPFERIQGGFIEVGALAANSVVKTGNSICWLGRSEDGDGVVFAMNGTQPERISTHAIEQAIKSYADPASATAYSYQSGGHVFYVLNFTEATWVYDLVTQMWHERAYLNAGELERHRVEVCAYVASQRIHLVGDYETNKVYTMSEDVFSDNGDEIMRLRSSPHISADGNRITHNRFQLDMETGIGLDGDVQGFNPTVMLDWSNDGGHTWSSEQFALADAGSGEIGDFKERVIWRRLGGARDRIYRIKITDPVKVRLINASIDVEARSS